MAGRLLACALAALATATSCAQPPGGASSSPWTVVKTARQPTELLRGINTLSRLERLDSAITLELDESMLDWQANPKGFIELPLVLPSGDEVLFELQSTDLMHPELSERFPQITTLTGESVGFTRVLHADVDYSPLKGLRAFIRDARGDYYLDPLVVSGRRQYKSYASRSMTSAEAWGCHLRRDGHPHRGNTNESESGPRVLSDKAELAAEYIFTLGLVANGEYSRYHGNTKEAVLAELVTVMNRVNGIFKRELGTFFQLHADTDKLICLHPCPELSNSDAILDQTDAFITAQGVSLNEIDIGHSLSTGSGGLACLGSLCGSFKTCGTTGLPHPHSDAFYVDYVAHEMGHQLFGDHTFQDCDGYRGGASTSVEPGSGSTILAYAGICGSRHNLQTNSDPYFHSKSLQTMRDYIERTVNTRAGCGVRNPTQRHRPVVSMPSKCVVPAGMPFRLAFTHDQAKKRTQGLHYTIEPVDSIAQADFLDRSQGRFRSWVPTKVPHRTFPNMYYLVHGLKGSVVDEIVPTRALEMTMRGTVREVYSATTTALDNSTTAGFGTFAYADTTVRFDNAVAPFAIARELRSLDHVASGDQVTLRWSPGDTAALAPNLEVMIAVNTLAYVGPHIKYDEDVHELQWTSLGNFSNQGEATFTLPSLHTRPTNTTVNLMLRSPDDSCSFFDLLPKVTFYDRGADATGTPTPPPVSRSPSASRSSTLSPSMNAANASASKSNPETPSEDLDQFHLNDAAAPRSMAVPISVIVVLYCIGSIA